MEEGLKIHVGADVLDVTKSLAVLEKEFKDLQKTIANATDGRQVIQLNKRLDELGNTIRAVKSAGRVGFDDFGQKLGSIKPAADKAGQSLVDFGRVVQDLPYGFVGISNNLNPLFDSFSRLRKETGSTGGALSALVGSLKGAGGLGLALSAISAAMSFVQVGTSAWTRGLGGAKKAVEEMSGFLGTTKDQLNQINSKFAEEASRVTVLVGALQKGSLSHEQIKSAKQELIRIAPQYFGHLDAESSKIDAVTAAYNNYNNSLIKAIENQIKTEKLTKAISDRLKVEEKNPLGLQEFQKLQKTGLSIDGILQKLGEKTIEDVKASLTGISGQYSLIGKDAQLAYEQQLKAGEKTQQNNKELESQLYRIASAYKAVQNIAATIDPNQTKVNPGSPDIMKSIEYIRQGLTPVEIPLSLKESKKKLGIEIKEIFYGIQSTVAESFGDGTIFGNAGLLGYKNFKEYWEKKAKEDPLYLEAPKVKLEGLNVNGDYSKFFTPMQKSIDIQTNLTKKRIEDFNKEITQILQKGYADALAGVGESIGAVIANGAKGLNAFASIGATLGNILIQVGKAAIGTGTAIEAIKKALQSLKGVGAIIAGVGLVALGSIIKTKLGNVSAGMALGGIVPPGYPNDSFPARLSSNEAVIPLDRLDSIMGNKNVSSGPMIARLVGAGPDLLMYMEQQSSSKRRSF